MMRSLLIIRDGYLLSENYFNGSSVNDWQDLRSATRSACGLLAGIALDQGEIDSVNQKLVDLLPQFSKANTDFRYPLITFDHLLTMRAGYEWNDLEVSDDYINAPNTIQYIVGRPFAAIPGERFIYDSASSHLVSVIISERSTLSFARIFMFRPLNINNIIWAADRQGYHYGGAGLLLTSLDFAKIGFLILKDRAWKGQQIVSRQWVLTAIARHVSLRRGYEALTSLSYGYLWWNASIGGEPVHLAWGHGGQFTFAFRRLGLLVMVTSDPAVDPDTADSHYDFVFKFLRDKMLRAISS